MKAMQEIMQKLPAMGLKRLRHEWINLCHLKNRIQVNKVPHLYALSLMIVFLCLAALYESWSVPFSVLLVVPLGVLGAWHLPLLA